MKRVVHVRAVYIGILIKNLAGVYEQSSLTSTARRFRAVLGTAAAYGILGTGPYRLRVFTSMHIQYQSFITKHYRIQYKVA